MVSFLKKNIKLEGQNTDSKTVIKGAFAAKRGRLLPIKQGGLVFSFLVLSSAFAENPHLKKHYPGLGSQPQIVLGQKPLSELPHIAAVKDSDWMWAQQWKAMQYRQIQTHALAALQSTDMYGFGKDDNGYWSFYPKMDPQIPYMNPATFDQLPFQPPMVPKLSENLHYHGESSSALTFAYLAQAQNLDPNLREYYEKTYGADFFDLEDNPNLSRNFSPSVKLGGAPLWYNPGNIAQMKSGLAFSQAFGASNSRAMDVFNQLYTDPQKREKNPLAGDNFFWFQEAQAVSDNALPFVLMTEDAIPVNKNLGKEWSEKFQISQQEERKPTLLEVQSEEQLYNQGYRTNWEGLPTFPYSLRGSLPEDEDLRDYSRALSVAPLWQKVFSRINTQMILEQQQSDYQKHGFHIDEQSPLNPHFVARLFSRMMKNEYGETPSLQDFSYEEQLELIQDFLLDYYEGRSFQDFVIPTQVNYAIDDLGTVDGKKYRLQERWELSRLYKEIDDIFAKNNLPPLAEDGSLLDSQSLFLAQNQNRELSQKHDDYTQRIADLGQEKCEEKDGSIQDSGNFVSYLCLQKEFQRVFQEALKPYKDNKNRAHHVTHFLSQFRRGDFETDQARLEYNRNQLIDLGLSDGEIAELDQVRFELEEIWADVHPLYEIYTQLEANLVNRLEEETKLMLGVKPSDGVLEVLSGLRLQKRALESSLETIVKEYGERQKKHQEQIQENQESTEHDPSKRDESLHLDQERYRNLFSQYEKEIERINIMIQEYQKDYPYALRDVKLELPRSFDSKDILDSLNLPVPGHLDQPLDIKPREERSEYFLHSQAYQEGKRKDGVVNWGYYSLDPPENYDEDKHGTLKITEPVYIRLEACLEVGFLRLFEQGPSEEIDSENFQERLRALEDYQTRFQKMIHADCVRRALFELRNDGSEETLEYYRALDKALSGYANGIFSAVLSNVKSVIERKSLAGMELSPLEENQLHLLDYEFVNTLVRLKKKYIEEQRKKENSQKEEADTENSHEEEIEVDYEQLFKEMAPSVLFERQSKKQRGILSDYNVHLIDDPESPDAYNFDLVTGHVFETPKDGQEAFLENEKVLDIFRQMNPTGLQSMLILKSMSEEIKNWRKQRVPNLHKQLHELKEICEDPAFKKKDDALKEKSFCLELRKILAESQPQDAQGRYLGLQEAFDQDEKREAALRQKAHELSGASHTDLDEVMKAINGEGNTLNERQKKIKVQLEEFHKILEQANFEEKRIEALNRLRSRALDSFQEISNKEYSRAVEISKALVESHSKEGKNPKSAQHVQDLNRQLQACLGSVLVCDEEELRKSLEFVLNLKELDKDLEKSERYNVHFSADNRKFMESILTRLKEGGFQRGLQRLVNEHKGPSGMKIELPGPLFFENAVFVLDSKGEIHEYKSEEFRDEFSEDSQDYMGLQGAIFEAYGRHSKPSIQGRRGWTLRLFDLASVEDVDRSELLNYNKKLNPVIENVFSDLHERYGMNRFAGYDLTQKQIFMSLCAQAEEMTWVEVDAGLLEFCNNLDLMEAFLPSAMQEENSDYYREMPDDYKEIISRMALDQYKTLTSLGGTIGQGTREFDTNMAITGNIASVVPVGYIARGVGAGTMALAKGVYHIGRLSAGGFRAGKGLGFFKEGSRFYRMGNNFRRSAMPAMARGISEYGKFTGAAHKMYWTGVIFGGGFVVGESTWAGVGTGQQHGSYAGWDVFWEKMLQGTSGLTPLANLQMMYMMMGLGGAGHLTKWGLMKLPIFQRAAQSGLGRFGVNVLSNTGPTAFGMAVFTYPTIKHYWNEIEALEKEREEKLHLMREDPRYADNPIYTKRVGKYDEEGKQIEPGEIDREITTRRTLVAFEVAAEAAFFFFTIGMAAEAFTDLNFKRLNNLDEINKLIEESNSGLVLRKKLFGRALTAEDVELQKQRAQELHARLLEHDPEYAKGLWKEMNKLGANSPLRKKLMAFVERQPKTPLEFNRENHLRMIQESAEYRSLVAKGDEAKLLSDPEFANQSFDRVNASGTQLTKNKLIKFLNNQENANITGRPIPFNMETHLRLVRENPVYRKIASEGEGSFQPKVSLENGDLHINMPPYMRKRILTFGIPAWAQLYATIASPESNSLLSFLRDAKEDESQTEDAKIPTASGDMFRYLMSGGKRIHMDEVFVADEVAKLNSEELMRYQQDPTEFLNEMIQKAQKEKGVLPFYVEDSINEVLDSK